MPTSIQISGFDKEGFHDSVAVELRKTIQDTDRLLFVASSPDEFEKLDEYTKRIFCFFCESGLNFHSYQILDKRMPDSEQEHAIDTASCIFLMGGYARVQLAYLKEQNVISSIKNHKGTVIGLSAGAINMAKRSVIANPYHPPVSVYAGMNMIDITVVPHFNDIKEEFIKKEIFPLTYDGAIYGLCDDAIIITQNGLTRHNGTIYKIAKGNMRQLDPLDRI